MMRTAAVRMLGAPAHAPLTAMAGMVGLAIAVTLRVQVAGVAGARSPVAGVVFGLALLLITAACGAERPSLGLRQIAWGIGGAGVLCLPPLLHWVVSRGVDEPSGALPLWATVVTLVAVAEELLLRGALFEAVAKWRGEYAAIATTAAAFALLHAPVYGWHVVPLDLAVGVALGVLRVVAGSVSAPLLTHVLADLAGWWLR